MELRLTWLPKMKLITLFSFLFFLSCSSSAKDLQPEIKFETAEIEVGPKKITVELAKTSVQQAKGLMYRDGLEKDKGMLFIFPVEQQLSFWMKNTYIDLSIAYIDKNLKIIDIQDMKATSPVETGEPKTYPSKKPAQYALEMTQGWFKKSNIKVGDHLKLPQSLK